jgi:hypothetical protein
VPITPFHFGPSGLIGLVFKRWIDLPVFLLANVVVDIEVLVIFMLGLGYPAHRHCHTLLIGGIVGVLWGLAAYLFRSLWQEIVSAFRLPYRPTIGRMVVSGVLGVWLHVLIDGTQHADMRIFWPNTTFCLATYTRPYVDHHRLELVCLLLLLCAFLLYGHLAAQDGRWRSGIKKR